MARKKKTDEEEEDVFNPDLDKIIRKGSAAIAKLLKNDPDGRYVRDLIEYHLKEIGESTPDDLTVALALAFGDDAGRTIAFPLFANDPTLLAEYERLNIPDRVLTFLHYLVALYGARAEYAVMCLEQPDGLENAHFDINYDGAGTVHSISMRLAKINNDSITIIDEPDSYLFLVYQILELLSGAEPTDASDDLMDALEKIRGRVEDRIKDSGREYKYTP